METIKESIISLAREDGCGHYKNIPLSLHYIIFGGHLLYSSAMVTFDKIFHHRHQSHYGSIDASVKQNIELVAFWK